MNRLVSKFNAGSPASRRNAERNRLPASTLRTAVALAALGGLARSRERPLARGKLLPRGQQVTEGDVLLRIEQQT